jgi:hypothetical protein
MDLGKGAAMIISFLSGSMETKATSRSARKMIEKSLDIQINKAQEIEFAVVEKYVVELINKGWDKGQTKVEFIKIWVIYCCRIGTRLARLQRKVHLFF